MDKMDKIIKFRKVKVGALLVSLSFAITSLAYVTYAWFVFNRAVEVKTLDVQVEKGIEFEMKYFIGNGNSGYAGPDYQQNDVNTSLNTYNSDFLPLSANFNELLYPISKPAFRLSYAVEINVPPSPQNRSINFDISGFYSPESLFNFDVLTNKGIKLSSAINVYSTLIDVTSGTSSLDSAAKTFISASNPGSGDRFDGTSSDVSLAKTVITSGQAAKYIVLFTVEFSDLANTYYSFSHETNGIKYYNLSTTGNSNPYQDLEFHFNSFSIYTS